MPKDVVELLVQRLDTREMLRVKGREAWTLNCLLETEQSGVVPLERPAPRWSAYVYSLRKRRLVIYTIDEQHAGPYSGTHGRYVLRTPLKCGESRLHTHPRSHAGSCFLTLRSPTAGVYASAAPSLIHLQNRRP